jgi:D-serine deaminase-like pyridoxal phosphate-dependent protein
MNDSANSNVVLKSQIETPALVIAYWMQWIYNLAMMAKKMREYSVNLRPHFKTHKTPLLAHKQIEAGAIGITCAKLEEAEVLVSAGIRSILIANQVVDPVKINRLAGRRAMQRLLRLLTQRRTLINYLKRRLKREVQLILSLRLRWG